MAVVDEPPSVAVIESPDTDSRFLDEVTQEVLDKMMEDFELNASQMELYKEMAEHVESNIKGLKFSTNEELDDVFNIIYKNGIQKETIPEIVYAHVFAKIFLKHGIPEKVPKTARDQMMKFLSKSLVLGPSRSTDHCPEPNFRALTAQRPQVLASSSSGASRGGPEAEKIILTSSDQITKSVEVSTGMATEIIYFCVPFCLSFQFPCFFWILENAAL